MGRALTNAVLNLDLEPAVTKALAQRWQPLGNNGSRTHSQRVKFFGHVDTYQDKSGKIQPHVIRCTG